MCKKGKYMMRRNCSDEEFLKLAYFFRDSGKFGGTDLSSDICQFVLSKLTIPFSRLTSLNFLSMSDSSVVLLPLLY